MEEYSLWALSSIWSPAAGLTGQTPRSPLFPQSSNEVTLVPASPNPTVAPLAASGGHESMFNRECPESECRMEVVETIPSSSAKTRVEAQVEDTATASSPAESWNSSEESWVGHLLNEIDNTDSNRIVTPVPSEVITTEWSQETMLEQIDCLIEKAKEHKAQAPSFHTFQVPTEEQEPEDSLECTGGQDCRVESHKKTGIFCRQHYHPERRYHYQLLHILVTLIFFTKSTPGTMGCFQCLLCPNSRRLFTYKEACQHARLEHGDKFGYPTTRREISSQVKQLVNWRRESSTAPIVNICAVCTVVSSGFLSSVVHSVIHGSADEQVRVCTYTFCLAPLYEETVHAHNRGAHMKSCCSIIFRSVSEYLAHIFSTHLHAHMSLLDNVHTWYELTRKPKGCLTWPPFTPILVFVDDNLCNRNWPVITSEDFKKLMNSPGFICGLLKGTFKPDTSLLEMAQLVTSNRRGTSHLRSLARDCLAKFNMLEYFCELWSGCFWITVDVPVKEIGPRIADSNARCNDCRDSMDHSTSRDRCVETRTLVYRSTLSSQEVLWQTELCTYAAFWLCSDNLALGRLPESSFNILNIAARSRNAKIYSHYLSGNLVLPKTTAQQKFFNFSEYVKSTIAALPKNCHSPVFLEFLDDKTAFATATQIYNAVSAHVSLVLHVRNMHNIPIVTVGPVPQYTWDMSEKERENEETRVIFLTNCLVAMCGRTNLMLLPLMGLMFSFRRNDINPPQWNKLSHWADEALYNPEGPNSPTREFSRRLGILVDQTIKSVARSCKVPPFDTQFLSSINGDKAYWHHKLDFV